MSDWREAASCAQVGYPELYFVEEHAGRGDYVEGRKICAGCSVQVECLEFAMESEGQRVSESRYGLWGGLDPLERAELARQRRKERVA